MKSMVKTTLTLSSLLLLTGCFDFGWSKKANEEKMEVATHAQAEHTDAAKCSHKGCTHDHSKDGHQKHHDDVKTQGMDDDMNDDMNDDEEEQN
jgi:ABC-type nickel/cobalt efflux system permease component RcnA